MTLLYSGYYNSEKEKYPFEVDTDFFYLTSCDISNVLLLQYNKHNYVHVEVPDIKIYDSEYFLDIIHKCFNAEVIGFDKLLQLLHKSKRIHTLSNISTHPKWKQMKHLTMDMTSISTKLSKKREIKFIDEKAYVAMACKYTSEGIKHILKHAYPNMSQIELSGLFKQSISKHGIQELSFNPITAHGKYNQYLHYSAKDRPVTKGSLVLLDLGCKYNHYCSDITRCFPISGKFTRLQQDIYNIVLKGLKYALKLMKPGEQWDTITKKVLLKLYDECLKIKLVKSQLSDDDKLMIMGKLMPHALGHHVGLDNHDCGNITTLKKDMVIAVEPGIYFQTGIDKHSYINKFMWKKYENLGGIRLEDTIIITDNGHKNLSKITKEISGIEKLIKK